MSGKASGRRGLPFVVAAPSGTGKTTVCRMAMERDPQLRFSISHTTRPQRSGERDGVDYHFVDREAFGRLVEEGAFVEHAEFNANLYGTSWASLDAPLDDGCDLMVEIEVQGARQLRERLTDACFVFLLPPSMHVLGERLRGRATDSEEAIQRRLAIADRELQAIDLFDYAIVNDDLEEAVATLLEIIDCRREGRLDAIAAHARGAVFNRWGKNVDELGAV